MKISCIRPLEAPPCGGHGHPFGAEPQPIERSIGVSAGRRAWAWCQLAATRICKCVARHMPTLRPPLRAQAREDLLDDQLRSQMGEGTPSTD